MNYVDTFIAVADDCRLKEGIIPPNRTARKSIALIQYELLAKNPYRYTQEDIQFETFIRHKDAPAGEARRSESALREKFFAKPQACLRSSPLPKKYGWGLHFDERGRVALYPIESADYRRLRGAALKVLKALRSSRAS